MTGRRWLGLSIVVVVAVLAIGAALVTRGGSERHASTAPGPAAPGPPARPAPAGEALGVNVNLVFNNETYSQAQIDLQLREARSAGATVARSDAFWESAEPTPPVDGVHHYVWRFDDEVAGSLAASGLRWMPILDYSAPWAESVPGQDHSPPSSAADYAAYAAAFAARFGDGGSFWRAHAGLTPEPVQTYEIWNEPDNGEFWVPTPNAGRYAALYQRARAAITAVDPSARVIVGGLKSPATFLPAMLASAPDLRGHIDGVAIHPYGNPLVVLSKIRAARATLTSLGLGAVPLYVTEFGWTTRPPGAVAYAPQSARPGYLTTTLTDLGHLNCGVAAALLYTWVSPQADPLDPQDWYGINGPTGAHTPDVAAFAAGLRAAGAARPTLRLCRS